MNRLRSISNKVCYKPFPTLYKQCCGIYKVAVVMPITDNIPQIFSSSPYFSDMVLSEEQFYSCYELASNL